jgi:hypothetical protein
MNRRLLQNCSAYRDCFNCSYKSNNNCKWKNDFCHVNIDKSYKLTGSIGTWPEYADHCEDRLGICEKTVLSQD